ncbi:MULTISPECIES: TIGR02452 family protein [Streptomyces]|uniref:TIGR02452 family protein n=1 Tax=Streptomyces TaxID=1883 RepID=UPI0021C02BCF|nr:TIGR02452 family protein [Streptomyces lusitanus]
MSARLRGIARETERVVAEGVYRAPNGHAVEIGAAVEAARQATTLHGPEPVPVPPFEPAPTRFEVTGESSLAAARRLTGPGAPEPVAVLNFASARNPGGGYLNGAQAQEEALCRASALYTCLLRAPGFYDHHRAHRDPFYTDRVIHAPAVPVFRDDRGALLDAPFTAGFLTSPAPNAGVVRARTPERVGEVPGALVRRAGRVLETAAHHGYRRLVLGAWGCGVFRNDPGQVAEAFRTHLGPGGRFEGAFAHVVFGILDRTRDGATRTAFERAFADLTVAPAEVTPSRSAP